MEEMEVALTAKSEEVKEAVRDDMRAEHASKATLKKAVETMPTTVAQVASFFLPPHIFHRPYHFVFSFSYSLSLSLSFPLPRWWPSCPLSSSPSSRTSGTTTAGSGVTGTLRGR